MKKSKTKKVTLDELFEVLSFYAEKENYDDIEYLACSNIFIDKGIKARKILKRLLVEELDKNDIIHNL